MILQRVVSGAQTGADRGGLDAAASLGIPTGGWCTKDCRTENGKERILIAKYNLTETDNYSYPVRTERNVRDSDGTVIFGNDWSPGSKATKNACYTYHKPFIINPDAKALRQWLIDNEIVVLNVAGNRESTNPGIYKTTFDIVRGAIG